MNAIKKALIPHSCPDGGIGRRNRLKICRPQGLRVQVPFRVPFSSQLTVPGKTALSTLKIHDFLSKCLVCLFFFCRAKNGTVHYGGGLPSLRSGSAALRAWSSPVPGTIFLTTDSAGQKRLIPPCSLPAKGEWSFFEFVPIDF